jgi:hypothetical protein
LSCFLIVLVMSTTQFHGFTVFRGIGGRQRANWGD